MAKPGSNAAAAIANGIDLSAMKTASVPLSEKDAAEARKKAELKLHMRCTGCGERIGTGFEFTRFIPQRGPEGVMVGKMTVAACNGAGAEGTCDFASEARDGATVVRIVEYVWLDADAPPVEMAEETSSEREGSPAEDG